MRQKKMTHRKWLIRLFGLAFGLGLFGWVIWTAIEKTQSFDWPALPIQHIVFASGLVFLAHGLHGLAWVVGARQIAPAIGVWDGIGIYALAFIGRYLPGKIWQIGGLSYLAKGRGADPYDIAGYSLVFLVFFQIIGAAIVLVCHFANVFAFGWLICLVSSLAIAIVMAAIYSIASERITALLPLKWKERVRGGLHQPFGALALNLCLLALVWLAFGTAGYVLVQGFAPEWAGSWAQVAMATIGGLIAGFLVLIAPSGAGIRESTISVWLASMGISPIASIAMAVALRVIMTAGELLWAAFGALLILRTDKAPMRHKG